MREIASGFTVLKKTLRNDVGFFEKEILYRGGRACAKDFFEKRIDEVRSDSALGTLEKMLTAYSADGFGQFSIERSDDSDSAVRISCVDTIEGLGYSTGNNPEGNAPACACTAGFLAWTYEWAFSNLLDNGTVAHAEELECVSQGRPRCLFLVGPAPELEKAGYKVEARDESISEHTLRLNEEILLRNLDLQNLTLTLERKVRKRTEELRRSEENYRSLIDLSPDPIIIVTMNGTVLSINQAGLSLLSFADRAEVEGVPLTRLVADDTDVFERLKWSLDKEGVVRNFEMRLADKSGSAVTVEASARFAEVDREKCIQAVLRDVTERNILEKQLLEAKEESEFLNDLLAHDIMNFTFAAIHFIENLERSQDLGESERKNLRSVSKSVRGAYELSSVVRDALKAKALEDRDRESKELVNVLDEAIEESKRVYSDRDVIVDFDRPDHPCLVQGNMLLPRLFSNLLTNSIKFDHHEEVVIGVSVQEVREREKEFWQVRIEDRGRGIADEEKAKVFDRYYRRDRSVPGTGLGLFLVSHLAHACGGSVHAENRVEGDYRKGTVMVVNLAKMTAVESRVTTPP